MSGTTDQTTLFTQLEVARKLGLTKIHNNERSAIRALQHLRRRSGCPAVRIGRTIMYRQADIDRIIAAAATRQQ